MNSLQSSPRPLLPTPSGAVAAPSPQMLPVGAGLAGVTRLALSYYNVPAEFWPTVQLATNLTAFSFLQGMGGIQGYSRTQAVRLSPTTYGAGAVLPLVIDSTLGRLHPTFQNAGTGNGILAFAGTIYYGYRTYVFTHATGGSFIKTFSALPLTGQLLIAAGVLGFCTGLGLGAATNDYILGPGKAALDYLRALKMGGLFRSTPLLRFDRQALYQEQMNDVVAQHLVKKRADQNFPRPLALFAAAHTGYAHQLKEWVRHKVTGKENPLLRDAPGARAEVITQFSDWARSQVTRLIIAELNVDSQTPGVNWHEVGAAARSLFTDSQNPSYHPQLELFYHYNYDDPQQPIDTSHFPAGRNPVEEVQRLKRAISHEGIINLHRSPQAQKEVAEGKLILVQMALSQLNTWLTQSEADLKKKYSDSQLNDILGLINGNPEEQKKYPEVVAAVWHAKCVLALEKIRTELQAPIK